MSRLKISDGVYLEGRQFDWALVYVSQIKTKDGELKDVEKKLYFPRLTQIAAYLVGEDAKLAKNAKELVDAINQSTQRITERLFGVEERLSRGGNTEAFIKDKAEEGVRDVITEKKTAGAIAVKRRRRKKA